MLSACDATNEASSTGKNLLARSQNRPLTPRSSRHASSGPSDVTRRKCECGTTVLFPPNHLHRTCWQCKRVIQLDVLGLSTSHAGANVSTSQHQGSPGAHSPPFETHENQPLTASNHGLLGEQTEPSQCARELEGMKATSEDQQPNNAHVHRSTSERALTPRSKRPSSKALIRRFSAVCICKNWAHRAWQITMVVYYTLLFVFLLFPWLAMQHSSHGEEV